MSVIRMDKYTRLINLAPQGLQLWRLGSLYPVLFEYPVKNSRFSPTLQKKYYSLNDFKYSQEAGLGIFEKEHIEAVREPLLENNNRLDFETVLAQETLDSDWLVEQDWFNSDWVRRTLIHLYEKNKSGLFGLFFNFIYSPARALEMCWFAIKGLSGNKDDSFGPDVVVNIQLGEKIYQYSAGEQSTIAIIAGIKSLLETENPSVLLYSWPTNSSYLNQIGIKFGAREPDYVTKAWLDNATTEQIYMPGIQRRYNAVYRGYLLPPSLEQTRWIYFPQHSYQYAGYALNEARLLLVSKSNNDEEHINDLTLIFQFPYEDDNPQQHLKLLSINLRALLESIAIEPTEYTTNLLYQIEPLEYDLTTFLPYSVPSPKESYFVWLDDIRTIDIEYSNPTDAINSFFACNDVALLNSNILAANDGLVALYLPVLFGEIRGFFYKFGNGQTDHKSGTNNGTGSIEEFDIEIENGLLAFKTVASPSGTITRQQDAIFGEVPHLSGNGTVTIIEGYNISFTQDSSELKTFKPLENKYVTLYEYNNNFTRYEWNAVVPPINGEYDSKGCFCLNYATYPFTEEHKAHQYKNISYTIKLDSNCFEEDWESLVGECPGIISHYELLYNGEMIYQFPTTKNLIKANKIYNVGIDYGFAEYDYIYGPSERYIRHSVDLFFPPVYSPLDIPYPAFALGTNISTTIGPDSTHYSGQIVTQTKSYQSVRMFLNNSLFHSQLPFCTERLATIVDTRDEDEDSLGIIRIGLWRDTSFELMELFRYLHGLGPNYRNYLTNFTTQNITLAEQDLESATEEEIDEYTQILADAESLDNDINGLLAQYNNATDPIIQAQKWDALYERCKRYHYENSYTILVNNMASNILMDVLQPGETYFILPK